MFQFFSILYIHKKIKNFFFNFSVKITSHFLLSMTYYPLGSLRIPLKFNFNITILYITFPSYSYCYYYYYFFFFAKSGTRSAKLPSSVWLIFLLHFLAGVSADAGAANIARIFYPGKNSYSFSRLSDSLSLFVAFRCSSHSFFLAALLLHLIMHDLLQILSIARTDDSLSCATMPRIIENGQMIEILKFCYCSFRTLS